MECAFLKMKPQLSCVYALFLLFLVVPSLGLSEDGTLLLSLKYSVSNDPLSVLGDWNYDDVTPCSWTGVSCAQMRVVGLNLPNSRLMGTIPEDLGYVGKLQTIDLTGNFLNGTLPFSLSIASELRVLNVSDNGLSGALPGGFRNAEVLDLSGNLMNGSLPVGFGGERLRYLNLSSNKLSGIFPPEFANKIPGNATIDLSFNNLTGEIPNSMALSNQKTEYFRGNMDLCGKPLNKACTIPSTFSTPPNVTTNSSAAAIAVIPQTIGSNPSTNPPANAASSQEQRGLKPGTIAGIAVGDLAGLGVIAMVCLYVYQLKTKRADESMIGDTQLHKEQKNNNNQHDSVVMEVTTTRALPSWSCLSLGNVEEIPETASESTASDHQTESDQKKNKYTDAKSLVMLDGETELELESLLRASAYILGSSTNSSIVYKAVLENGTAFVVRRIGDGVERLKEFENHAKAIAKLRHPNLVVLRGFYWGEDEKLVIYDYISNGSLANADYKRMGSSPYHMPFQVRVKIAKGVARGLAYIHEKKNVHGNIKPSNILLTPEMEPVITDLGLHRLMYGNKTTNHHHTDPHSASRHFGSKRANAAAAAAPSAAFLGCTSPYHAPESFNNLKPNPKWDVYSFGVLLLELLTEKVFSGRELGEWASGGGHLTEDRDRVLRMADAGIRGGGEDALMECFKLGFKCASLIPAKRPSMKDARQVLDKIPCASSY